MTANGFIQQTANDYDMRYEEVERIYILYKEKGLFYEKLEEHILEKSELAKDIKEKNKNINQK